MSDSYAARGGDLTNVPSSSYYLPQQIEAMSHGWATRGGTGSETVRLSGDGRHIEWSQIRIGFGIGMLLAMGLGLSLKGDTASDSRPLIRVTSHDRDRLLGGGRNVCGGSVVRWRRRSRIARASGAGR